MTEEPSFDPSRMVATLARHQVAYLVIGGVAVNVYGSAERTQDFDCLARFDRENLDRLAAAMRELDARIRAEGLSDAEAIEFTRHLPSAEVAFSGVSCRRG
ncbi:hypothetical protein BH24ACT5_BH24ACT5_08620 [soil metagenome]